VTTVSAGLAIDDVAAGLDEADVAWDPGPVAERDVTVAEDPECSTTTPIATPTPTAARIATTITVRRHNDPGRRLTIQENAQLSD
jgi:hypothetical protein